MSNIIKKQSSEIAHINSDELESGNVYMYKEYDNWYRVSIVPMSEEDMSRYSAGFTHWALIEGRDKKALKSEYFNDPERLIRCTESQFSDLKEQARSIMEGESNMNEWLGQDESDKAEEISTSNALQLSGGKKQLDDALVLAKTAQGLMASKRAALEMVVAEKMAVLAAMKSAMNSTLTVLRKKVKEVMRVVTMIELYMGIDEELIQIGDGERASVDEPITMRQLMLYMDEEVGSVKDGGIDWTNIEDFDKWLIEEGGLDVIAPEKKCLVSLQPRRRNKHYSDDAFDNMIKNIPNKATYFLIRNGDCVWRITTENLGMQEVLFPKRKQMEELSKILGGIDDSGNSKHYWDRDKEKAEDVMFDFRRRVFFMQGLIDRTDCFEPIKGERINVMNLDGEDRIRFVYDAESALTDGTLSWREFQRNLNDQIQRGSRVVLAPHNNIYTDLGRKNQERFFAYYSNEYSIPSFPDGGLYEVDSKMMRHSLNGDEKETYFIKYNPGDEIYSRSWSAGYQSHERKNRLSFIIKTYDNWVLNYDLITIPQIDYYLKSRLDRPDYLTLIPTLKEMKKHKLIEQESEEAFKMMVKGQVQVTDALLDEVVTWWKMKTIFKRPISKDDAKALRMIVSEIKKRK